MRTWKAAKASKASLANHPIMCARARMRVMWGYKKAFEAFDAFGRVEI